MFTIESGGFRFSCVPDGLPAIYSSYRERAALLEEISLDEPDAGRQCFFAITRVGEESPLVVVGQRFEPAGYGFEPGALVVPETQRLFLGAGKRLLAYDLSAPKRLWEDATDVGFWGWTRHGDIVFMSAELELAAWDLTARKLWATSVEPPWSYSVREDQVMLDVMGAKSQFQARSGPGGHRVAVT
jgi:hypothetical protein